MLLFAPFFARLFSKWIGGENIEDTGYLDSR